MNAPEPSAATPATDDELLRRYAAHHDQQAFATLAARYVNFVYSTAVRQVHDRHLAEDVTQAVFIVLSQKAGKIRPGTILSNWLFVTTRYAAANARKTEARRRHYEHQSATMPTPRTQHDDHAESTAWEDVAPLLDTALAGLGRREREAVLLKYVDGKSNQDVAALIGISEEAARKRVSRAVERMRDYFHSKGVALSIAALTTFLASRSVEAAPQALAASVTGGANIAAASAAGAGIAKGAAAMMTWAKIKIAALWLVGAAVLGSAGAVTVHEVARHRAQVAAPKSPPTLPANPAIAVAAPAAGAGQKTPAQSDVIEGFVRAPDDAPLPGAEVFIATKTASVQILDAKWPNSTIVTDANGHFAATAPKGPWMLVIRHISGYAQITPEEFAQSKEIWLAPWGRVEGKVMVGDKPQAGWSVMMSRWGSAEEWDITNVRADAYATTDADGKFVFDPVPPGDIWVSHANGKKPPRGGQILHDRKMTLLDTKPGKTMTVQIGGTGRPVIGRLPTTVADDPDLKLIWTSTPNRHIDARFHRSDLPQLPNPPNWAANTTPEEHTRRYFAWLKTTPEGRYHRAHNNNEEFDINPDGTFRIDDVTPGKYDAYFDYSVREGRQMGPNLIGAFVQFEIKEMPGGRSDEPLDVGLVTVKLRPRLIPGKPAPDFTVTTLDGKSLKLSDLKGKTVFLKLWYNWDKIEEKAPPLKKAQWVLAENPDIVLLNVSFTDTPEVYKQKLAQAVPGLHARGTHETFPNAYTSWPIDICVIDPGGKVRTPSLRLEALETEAAKIALEK
jgi:RNA polymerase sigma factor (sigma-70 family)